MTAAGPSTLETEAREPLAGTEALTGPSEQPRSHDYALLAALACAHFFNDFCLGVTTPMIPTMERRFDLSLGGVAGLVAGMTICANLCQPAIGWMVDRSRTARILYITPLVAGSSLLIGLVSEVWQTRIILMMAGAAVGAFHPFALIVAQRTLTRMPALSTSIFISFGFAGASIGALVSGVWMERRGFQSLHYLYGLVLVVLVVQASVGLGRLRLADYASASSGSRPAGKTDRTRTAWTTNQARRAPILFLMLVGLLIAIEGNTLFFFVPKYFKELYGSEGLGGKTICMFGLLGGLGSYLYGYLSDRGNPYRVILYVQAAAIAPLIGFFYFSASEYKFIMMILIGATVGGSFPVMASLALDAKGLKPGMRIAVMLGGVWGSASVISLLMAQLPDHGIPLERVMSSICLAPFALIPLLAYAARRYHPPA